MPDSPSRSSVHIDVSAAGEPAPRPVDPDEPFRILVIGDFSGRGNRAASAQPAPLRAIRVDIDNFEDVMETLQTALDLPRASLRFRELDDFHPDRIYRAAHVFEKLAELRPPAAAAAAPAPRTNLLEDLIGQSEDRQRSARAEDAGDLAAFIERVSASYLEERPDASSQAWQAKLTAAACEQMRTILHHPQFQALEAAWRSLWMLLQGLGPEDGVEIYLCDTSLADLDGDAAAIVRLISGAKKPWGLLVADFSFGEGAGDAARLRVLGRAAQAAGAPLLAEALPPSGESGEEWAALRRSPEARSIGLALPRFLARLPYGRSTSPVEALPLEEMPESIHAHYLWGNPAFCCALLIGQAFRANGWQLRPGIVRRIDGMPHHVYQRGGESVSKPCAEVLLTEREADQLLENGLMPLASLKDQDAVLLVRFCSIADPPAPLAGGWQRFN